MATCEDYPCCGHTDGLGCDWTYTPEARAFDEAHWNCQHEDGWCEAEEPEVDDDFPMSMEYGEDTWPMEDQHLDGSYEM